MIYNRTIAAMYLVAERRSIAPSCVDMIELVVGLGPTNGIQAC